MFKAYPNKMVGLKFWRDWDWLSGSTPYLKFRFSQPLAICPLFVGSKYALSECDVFSILQTEALSGNAEYLLYCIMQCLCCVPVLLLFCYKMLNLVLSYDWYWRFIVSSWTHLLEMTLSMKNGWGVHAGLASLLKISLVCKQKFYKSCHFSVASIFYSKFFFFSFLSIISSSWSKVWNLDLLVPKLIFWNFVFF